MTGRESYGINIPVVFMPYKDGAMLAALILQRNGTQLSITGPMAASTARREDLENWSSGGPTIDGRIKPDVVVGRCQVCCFFLPKCRYRILGLAA